MPVAKALQTDLATYLAQRGKIEHISAASLSVNTADGRWIDVAAGTTSYGGNTPVTPKHLFQIGSNTKAFTGTLTVKLESQHKLAVTQTLGRWLPQYPQWSKITIHRLLDMTSGIETYDNTQRFQRDYSADPYHYYKPKELIAYIPANEPLHSGYRYTNSGYELDEMIIEKATGLSYTDALRSMVIGPTGIADLYFYPSIYPQELRDRTVDGYFDNDIAENDGLKPLLGRSMRNLSLSWAQAAGGIVATPHAMAQWARDLYQGDILTASERTEMETMISTKTAKPIAEITPSDPGGFGLGVVKMYKPGLGAFWFYEGETLGYRMVHCYFPKQNLVLAVGLNSQPKSDDVGVLIESLTKTLKQYGLF